MPMMIKKAVNGAKILSGVKRKAVLKIAVTSLNVSCIGRNLDLPIRGRYVIGTYPTL
jgi:hypothetical protein